MSILEKLKARVRTDWQRIVLPEGEDPRVIAAAGEIVRNGYASLTLLGSESAIREAAARAGISLDGAKLLDPAASPALGGYARILHERRRAHGLTLDEANQMARPLYFAALMVAAEMPTAAWAARRIRPPKPCARPCTPSVGRPRQRYSPVFS